MKYLCTRSAIYGANVPASSYQTSGTRFLRTTDITETGDLIQGGVYAATDQVAEYKLDHGDLLISRSGTLGRSFLYDAAIHPPAAYAGYLVRFVLGSDLDPKFAFFYTKSRAFLAYIRANSIESTIGNVNGQKYARCPVPVPPISEQRRIVRVLEELTGEVARLISERSSLVGSLEEHQQGLIRHCVSVGLDTSVRLRRSGILWIGDVPEHWRMTNLRELLRQTTRCGRPELPLLSVLRDRGVIARDQLEDHENRNVISEDLRSYKVVRAGQFVVNKMKAWQGSYAVSTLDGIVSPAYFTFDVRSVNPIFFHWAIRSTRYLPFFAAASDGVRVDQWDLSIGRARSIPFLLPPPDEQERVVAFLEKATADVSTAIRGVHREIDLLREYRTALISDVVTGKLDVRGAAERQQSEGSHS